MPNFAELLRDPTTSSFVREVVQLTAGRDTVDVVNDLDVLVRACETEGDNIMDKFLVRRIVREDAVVDAELSDQMREQIQDDIVTRYDGLPDSLISNLCQAVVDFE